MKRTPGPLSHEEARDAYERIGTFQDRQRYERKPLADLVQHGAFASATAVFELGSGTGALAARLLGDHLPKHATYRAVDLSDAMLRLTAKRVEPWRDRCDVIRVDGTMPLPGDDGAFDRFIATYVLDLLASSEADAIIAEASRLLRPGGLLCLAGLTHGETRMQRLVTRMWNAVWRRRPSLVGGCRPIEIEPMIGAGWHAVHHEVVASWGVPSEVLIAERRPS